MLDGWVYLSHGHVFANAQTGNVVLLAIALSTGNIDEALRHVTSLVAFIVGLFLSSTAGDVLKRYGRNSRTVRLLAECGLLVVLALTAERLSDAIVTAAVGFIAAVQITSLSRFGDLSFNTGMTTGNLRSAVTAFVEAMSGPDGTEWFKATAFGSVCLAFACGALLAAGLTPHLRGATVLVVAAFVLAGTLAVARLPDPLPN